MDNMDNTEFDENELEQLLEDYETESPAEVTEEKEKAPEKKKEEKLPWQKSLVMYLHDFVYLVAVVIVVLLLFFRVVIVSGTSMNGTLLDGDYLLLIGNSFYHDPQYGDIIVASKESFKNGEPIVKRVIATEGQTVDIDFEAGIVYVDGVALDEPYTYTKTNIEGGMSFPLTVEEGCIFVLGDNRNGSRDSRFTEIGLIDQREVLGKVVLICFPGTNGEDAYGDPRVSRDFSRIGVVE